LNVRTYSVISGPSCWILLETRFLGHGKGPSAIMLGSLLVSALNGQVDNGLEDSGAIAVIPYSECRPLPINTGTYPLAYSWVLHTHL